MEDYLAEIRLTAANYAPRNWALCNGQLLSLAQNQALFSLLGTTYGGNGIQTFALPDIRGRVVVGTDKNNLIVPGMVGGTPTQTLAINEMPAHQHMASITPQPKVSLKVSSANASLTAVAPQATLARMGTVATARGSQFQGFFSYTTAAPDTALNPVSITGIANLKESNIGGGQPHTNIQPYLGINYMICLQGIYPSRN